MFRAFGAARNAYQTTEWLLQTDFKVRKYHWGLFNYEIRCRLFIHNLATTLDHAKANAETAAARCAMRDASHRPAMNPLTLPSFLLSSPVAYPASSPLQAHPGLDQHGFLLTSPASLPSASQPGLDQLLFDIVTLQQEFASFALHSPHRRPRCRRSSSSSSHGNTSPRKRRLRHLRERFPACRPSMCPPLRSASRNRHRSPHPWNPTIPRATQSERDQQCQHDLQQQCQHDLRSFGCHLPGHQLCSCSAAAANVLPARLVAPALSMSHLALPRFSSP